MGYKVLKIITEYSSSFLGFYKTQNPCAIPLVLIMICLIINGMILCSLTQLCYVNI
jgi:hypothetical protein